MADFNPDEYLAKQKPVESKFNPDAYLGTGFESEEHRSSYLEGLPQLEGVMAGEDMGAATIAALLTTTDPQEMADIITANNPNVNAVYPGSGMAPILVNQDTGIAVNTGKEGIQGTDVLQFLGLAAAYTPAGRGANLTLQGLSKLAGREGATEAIIQGGQSAAGGEFNPEEVAMTTALAPVGQVVSEKVLEPALGALQKHVKNRMSPSAGELMEASTRDGVPLTTSDVIPPRSAASGLASRLTEGMPLIGMSGVRGKQQLAREKATEGFEAELPAYSDADMVADLSNNVDKIKSAAGNRLQIITEKMGNEGEVYINKTLEVIDDEILKLSRLGKIQDPAALNALQEFRDTLIEAPQDFRLLRENRTQVRERMEGFDPVSKVLMTSPSKASLQRVYDSMTADLDQKVLATGGSRMLDRYKRADRVYAGEAKKLTGTKLRNILNEGDQTPEAVNRLLFSKTPSEQKRLYQNLSVKGRDNARAAILHKAFDGVDDGLGRVSPNKLASNLKKLDSQIEIYFKGEQKIRLNGLKKLLLSTKRAQEVQFVPKTGMANMGIFLTSLGGAAVSGHPAAIGAAASTGGVALLSRLYESKAVRNALLELGSAKKGSKREKEIINSLTTTINANALAASKQEDEE